MITAFWQKLDSALRLLLPLLTTALLVLISIVPWPIPQLGAITPALALIGFFYWSVHRPDLFHASTVFGLGLLQDVVNYLPIGLTALLFVALRQLLITQRRFFVGHSFLMLWSGFAITMLIASFGHWLILSLLHWQSLPLMPLLLQAVLTILIFPLPAWLLIWLQRNLLARV